MSRFAVLLLVLMVMLLPAGVRPADATNYKIEKVTEGVYAAIAQPGSKAVSNAMIVVTRYQVLLAGAHFVPEGIKELTEAIAEITPIPLRYVILTHHHRGFNYVDFDLPANAEIITSWQTWQSLRSESREIRNHVTFFDRGMTLIRGDTSIVLNNTDLGHSEGDLFVYLPREGVLFTSDLFYNDMVGYMGEGHMREWVLTLEMMEAVGARVIIPGLGETSTPEGIKKFRVFFKDFLTETLGHIEKGETLEETKKRFSLPKYEGVSGYKAFLQINLERAYHQLKE